MVTIAKKSTEQLLVLIYVVITLLFISSCSKQNSEIGTIKFTIKNLKCEVSEYGKRQLGGSEMMDLSYTHTGTIIADGGVNSPDGSYIVYYEITRVSGGDPNDPRRPGNFGMSIVRDGVGDLVISGGQQRVFNPPLFAEDEKPWDQETIEVKIIGCVKIEQQNNPTSSEKNN